MYRWRLEFNIIETTDADCEPTEYIGYITAPTLVDAMEIAKVKKYGINLFTNAEWGEEVSLSGIRVPDRIIALADGQPR